MTSRKLIAVAEPDRSVDGYPWLQHDLGGERPFRVAFAVPLDGDLVMSPEHLGVAYLSAVLEEAGARCITVEVPRGEAETAAAIEDMKDFDPDLIGITLTTVGVDHVVELGRQIRARLSERAFIVVGGALATHLGEKLLDLDDWRFVDGLVRGEGEIPIVELARGLRDGGSLDAVPNLCHRSNGRTISNALAPAVNDLDDLPSPSRAQFEQRGAKLSPSFSYIRISTSRGCTSFCTFCNAPHARNRLANVKPWRGCSPKRVVDEIEALYQAYGCTTFDFVDSTFEDPGGTAKAKARIRAIAEGIIERDLPIFFNCCMQAVNWSPEDRPLIELLHRAGLEKVLVGIEGGSDAELQRWKKRADVSNNEVVLDLLRSHNIYVAFGFIALHPNSTFETIRDNYSFLSEHLGHNFRRFTTRLELYPGAEVVDQLREEGLLRESYDLRLDPFGYTFRDARVAELARLFNLLYGEEYERSCVVDVEPAPFQFETYDIVVHTYYSRMLRQLTDDALIPDVQHDLERANALRDELARRNYEFVSHCVDLAEAGELRRLSVPEARAEIEDLYREAMRQLRSVQMGTSMKAHRAGHDVAELVGVRRLTERTTSPAMAQL